MGNIYLVRHGQSYQNAGLTQEINSGMTHLGHLQAINAGLLLQEKAQSLNLITSPFLRTIETANILKRLLHVVSHTTDPSLREVPYILPHEGYEFEFSFGVPFSIGERSSNAIKIMEENFEQYQIRLHEFVLGLKNDLDYLIVSHGMVIYNLYELLTDKKVTWPDWSERVPNGSIIDVYNRRITFNDGVQNYYEHYLWSS